MRKSESAPGIGQPTAQPTNTRLQGSVQSDSDASHRNRQPLSINPFDQHSSTVINDNTARKLSFNELPSQRRSLMSNFVEKETQESVQKQKQSFRAVKEKSHSHHQPEKFLDRSKSSDSSITAGIAHSYDKRALKRKTFKKTDNFENSSSVNSSDSGSSKSEFDLNEMNKEDNEEPRFIARELKKNRRLFPNGMPWNDDSAEEDDEGLRKSLVITSASLCPYCMMRDPGFVNADCLKMHYVSACMALCHCDFCDRIVKIAELTEHQLNRCPFVDRNLEMCPHCGLARFIGQDTHPKCRLKLAPIGSAWCPLCSAHITEDRGLCWRRHLIDDCYNNPRNKRWPRIQDSIRDDQKVDKRGDILLRNLNKAELNKAGSIIGVSPAHNQICYNSSINVNQLRNAVRRLNHEYRSRSRPAHVSVMSQHIIHHDDSD